MSHIHNALKNHILVDGFAHVADLEKSHGSWFVNKFTKQEYLDCYSLHSSQPIGWNHPKLDKYKDLMTKVMFHNITNSDLYTEEYVNFVDEFAKLTPDFKYKFFISGGTLGVENALKAAFDWKAQKLGITQYDDEKYVNSMDVIHFQDAFHGRSGYTLSLTNTGPLKTKFFPKFNWTRIHASSLDNIEKCLKHRLTAAIIIETIQGEGGDKHFSPDFFQALRNLADDYDAMLILDEVQTGLGLTGKTWAYQHYGIIPDMICFGKKTQVCGFCSTTRIDEVRDNVFNVSGRINSTWGGNLVDMVRAYIYFKIIEEDNLIENAQVVGDYFLNKLKELPLNNVRGQGLLIAFDLPHENFFKQINEKIFCLKSGTNSVRFRPHLTFSKEDADFAIEHIKSIL